MRNKTWFAATALMLTGCAASTGVIDAGNGTFYASKQSGNAFAGAGNIKGDLLGEANAFCQQRGQALAVIDVAEAKPPFVLGNYPRAQIDFKCTAR